MFLFHRAQQRKARLPRPFGDLVNAEFRDFAGVDAAYAYTLLMNGEHDFRRFFRAFAENIHQHQHHKFHRGVIVVVQQHAIQLGFAHFLFGQKTGFAFRRVFMT